MMASSERKLLIEKFDSVTNALSAEIDRKYLCLAQPITPGLRKRDKSLERKGRGSVGAKENCTRVAMIKYIYVLLWASHSSLIQMQSFAYT